MKIIPPRVSSRQNNHCGVSTNVPSPERRLGDGNLKQTPPPGGTFMKTPKGTNRREGIEARTHWIIRSPLSDRLHERRRAFERLLTRSAEKLRGTQSNVYFAPPSELCDTGGFSKSSSYHLHPPIYINESANDLPKSARPTETNGCGEANGSSEPADWTATHLKRAGQDGSLITGGKIRHGVNMTGPEKGDNEARLPDLSSIGSDASQEANNSLSKQSVEGKTPTKRRSVKALAAMFEGQHDSPPLARKPWAGVLHDAVNLAEGADQDESMPCRIHSSPQKPCHPTKTLHSHPEVIEDVEMKDMEDDKCSPSSNTWSLVGK